MNALTGTLFKRITNLTLAFLVATSTLSVVGPFVGNASAATVIDSTVADLATNVAAASAGDTINLIDSGTVSSQVIINKSLKITSLVGSEIIVAEGINAFGVQANDVTIEQIDFVGPYDFGDGAVTRGIVVSPGSSNITIRDNTFSHVRQPAYIDENVTGLIHANYADNTKGWVVLTNSDLTFTGNIFGDNVLDIALIAGPSNNYTDAEVVAISDANDNAVVENQFGPTKRLSDSYVQTAVTGRSGDEGSKWNPYVGDIQAGLARIVEGGTVNVANGDYTQSIYVVANGTKLVGQSKAGVQITSSGTTPSGHAVAVENVNNVTLQDLSFTIGAVGNPGYALKAYNTANLTVNNVDFTGRAWVSGPRTGGVDLNAVDGATISNVTATNFSKNGFAVTAKYAVENQASRNITFDTISSTSNAWAGLAFYNSNNAGTVAGDITGIEFIGTNTIDLNVKGLEIIGDTDANAIAGNAPAYQVTDGSGNAVDLSSAVFNGNALNIINYQIADLLAVDTSFDGKKGSEMTEAERTALGATIVDVNDNALIGEVIFYIAPVVVVPGTDTPTDTPAATTPTVTNIVTPIITNPASVLGAGNTTSEGSTDVEGTTDDKTATVKDGFDGVILGLAWYWWILILAGATGLTWWILAAYRRRNTEE
jgi:hypothetical protein